MTALPERLLAHDRLYIPWDAQRPLHEIGAPLAQRLHEHHGSPVTVVCPEASNAPIRLASAAVVTERDGVVAEGGIVLAYCPTHRLARKFIRLRHSVVIVVEWSHASYLGWARLTEAYNVVTGEVHSTGLSPAGRRAVDQIIACGDLSWTDAPARTRAARCLDTLTALGEYSPDVIVACARDRWGESPIGSLEKLLAEYSERPTGGRPRSSMLG